LQAAKRTFRPPESHPQLVRTPLSGKNRCGLKIAQHFSAGNLAHPSQRVPQGRKSRSAVPAGTLSTSLRKPSDESLGYCHSCLVSKTGLAWSIFDDDQFGGGVVVSAAVQICPLFLLFLPFCYQSLLPAYFPSKSNNQPITVEI